MTGFHYPSTRVVLTGARFPLTELTGNGNRSPVKRQLRLLTRVEQWKPGFSLLHIVKTKKTRGWALDRVHNSRRPLDDHLFALCDLVTLAFDLLT